MSVEVGSVAISGYVEGVWLCLYRCGYGYMSICEDVWLYLYIGVCGYICIVGVCSYVCMDGDVIVFVWWCVKVARCGT